MEKELVQARSGQEMEGYRQGPFVAGRDLFIDFSKGCLIALVVLGHSVQAVDNDFAQNNLFSFIYSFHMPLFFTLSGFAYWLGFSSSSSTRSVRKSLSKKFTSLYRPFIFWSTFLFALTAEKQTAELGVFEYFSDPFSAYWFLDILFFLFFVVLLAEKFLISGSGSKVKIISVVLLAALTDLVFHKLFGFALRSYHVLYYLPYFLLGMAAYELRPSAVKLLNISHSKFRKFIFFVLSAVLLFVVTSAWVYPGSVKLAGLQVSDLLGPLMGNLLEYLVRFLCVLSALVFVSMLFAVLPYYAKQILILLGISSLEIYLLHGFYVKIIAGIVGGYFIIAASVLISCLASIFLLQSLSGKSLIFQKAYRFCFGRSAY